MTQQSTSLSIRRLYVEHFVVILTVGLVFVFAGILIHGYLGRPWSEVQSFRIVDGWCKQGVEGIGGHCFGDFGLPYNRGLKEYVYSSENYAAANTPITASIFEFFRLFSYNTSLAVYLAWLFASIILPLLLFPKELDRKTRIQLTVLAGALTTGAISAIDRGNHVAMIVPLLVMYLLAINRQQWWRATLFLTAIAMLKFWGIIFIVALVARKRWVHAMSACVGTVLASLAILAVFPRSLRESLGAMLTAAGDRDYANSIIGFAISIQGFLRRTSCAVNSDDWCNTTLHGESWTASPLISIGVAVFLSILAILFFANKDVPLHISSGFVVSLGFLAVPEAPVYNLVLIVSLVAFIASMPNVEISREWFRSSVALLVAMSISSIPLTVYSNYPSRFASGTGEGPAIFRSDFWLIPMVWIGFVIVSLLDLVQSRCFKTSNEMQA